MTMTVRAVFVGGVLRPMEPIALEEGETVDVTIAKAGSVGPERRPPSPEEEDYARRLKAAKTLAEMYAVMETAPPSPDDTHDIVKMINESRRLTGFRVPDLEPAAEAPR